MPFLSKSTRKLLVNTLVTHHFDYSSEVWSSASKTSLKRLDRLYSKASKLGADGDIMTLQDPHDKNLAILTFKCLNNLALSYLQEKCILTSPVNQKNTRSYKYNKVYIERKKIAEAS